MLKAYKYQLTPNNAQKELLNKHFGACRFLYNLALETRTNAYVTHRVSITYFDMCKQLTDLKKDVVWLNEVSNAALQHSLSNLETAYKRFFKGQGGFPNFHKKTGRQSYHIPDKINVDFNTNHLFIPKFRKGIKFFNNREFTGTIRNCNVSKSPTGKYYVSILVEDGIELPKKKPVQAQTAVGIDLGIASFLTTSEGVKIGNPKFLKKDLSRLKYLQRQASKKVKGSKNRKKANLKIALCHERITNKRNNFLHHTSKQLVNSHDTICVETLQVKNMIKNHNLAQAISDVSWGEFIRQIEYKAEWQGKNVLRIGTFEPSSKLCSVCGHSHKLELSDRQFTCLNCGTFHDRDSNAATNIKNFALKNMAAGKVVKKSVKQPSLLSALKRKDKNLGLCPK